MKWVVKWVEDGEEHNWFLLVDLKFFDLHHLSLSLRSYPFLSFFFIFSFAFIIIGSCASHSFSSFRLIRIRRQRLSLSLSLSDSQSPTLYRVLVTEFWLPSFGYRVFQCVFHEKRKKTRICGDWPIACLPPFLETVDHNWRVAVTHTHTHRHTRYANEAPVCKCDRDLPRPARARHLPACSFFFSFFLPSLDRKLGNQ